MGEQKQKFDGCPAMQAKQQNPDGPAAMPMGQQNPDGPAAGHANKQKFDGCPAMQAKQQNPDGPAAGHANKQKFDGYAAEYDAWFMKNEHLFTSELRLFKKVLGDITGKRLLSVGCGSGLFESYIDCSNIEGIEPSRDMCRIAEKRGVNVISYGLIEDADLPDETYDIIYFNGSSSYIEDLEPVYGKCRKALKKGGRMVLLDVPKESAFGFMYLLGKSLGTYEHEYLNGAMPELPYPLALASSGVWHTTEEKIGVLKALGFGGFSFYQTLIKNPLYTNEEPEEVSEGYKSGGYVAIAAVKK